MLRMSRHEGVSCDSCLIENFCGKRYKCLICYDYDMCSTCYEAGATTTRHTTDHPMQCILARTDFDVFYGGESVSTDKPQAFTCPFCGKMGLAEYALHEHVTSEHSDVSMDVVCPICASMPGGDANHTSDDFASHLALEHHSSVDFEESSGTRHMRRLPHYGRGGNSRPRRGNIHLGSSINNLTRLSPSSRESMDPIAELLSQLSGVRTRAAAPQSVSSQLQQLEMQLQSTRQQLERLPRRNVEAASKPAPSNVNNANTNGVAKAEFDVDLSCQAASGGHRSQFLLVGLTEGSSAVGGSADPLRMERNIFVQELLLSSLMEQLQVAPDSGDPFVILRSLCAPEPQLERDAVTAGSVEDTDSKPTAKKALSGLAAIKCSEVVSDDGKIIYGGAQDGTSCQPGGSHTSPFHSTVRHFASASAVNCSGGKVPASLPGLVMDGRAVSTLQLSMSELPIAPSHLTLSPPPSPPVPSPLQPQGSTVGVNEPAVSMQTPRHSGTSVATRGHGRVNAAGVKRGLPKQPTASRHFADRDPPPH